MVHWCKIISRNTRLEIKSNESIWNSVINCWWQLVFIIQGKILPKLLYNCMDQKIKEKYLTMLMLVIDRFKKLIIDRFKEKFMFRLNRNSSGVLLCTLHKTKGTARLQQRCTKEKKEWHLVFFIIPLQCTHPCIREPPILVF